MILTPQDIKKGCEYTEDYHISTVSDDLTNTLFWNLESPTQCFGIIQPSMRELFEKEIYPLFIQTVIEGLEDEHLIIIKPEQNISGWRYHIVEQDNKYEQTYSGFSYPTRLEAKEQGILCVFGKLSKEN